MRRIVYGLTAVFAIAVSLLKLGQHFSLQTQAYDLGIYANVIWNTSQGRFFQDSINGTNYLADHFSPALILLAPLFWLWKNAAVLVLFQSLALACAVPAVYRLAVKIVGNHDAALCFTVWFTLSPHLHGVSRDDFHAVALGIPLLLWALYFLETGEIRWFFGFIATAALLQEDTFLVIAGVGFYAAVRHISRKSNYRWGLLLAGACVSLFLIVVFVLMPSFHSSWRPGHWGFYSNLGETPAGMFRSLLHPGVLWENSFGDPEKAKSFLRLLLWTGGLCLLAAAQLILLVLPLAYNLLSSNPAQYGLENHYVATALPFLFYSTLYGYRNLSEEWDRRRWTCPRWCSPLFFMVMITLSLFNVPRYYEPIKSKRATAVAFVLQTIPSQASVQTMHHLVPHLCLREHIAVFPDRRPAQWFLMDLAPPPGLPYSADYLDGIALFAKRNRGYLMYENDRLLLYGPAPSQGKSPAPPRGLRKAQ